MPDDTQRLNQAYEVVEEVKRGEVWKLRDPSTGRIAYGKTASPSEIAMTQRAAGFSMPVDSPLSVVRVLAAGVSSIPPALVEPRAPFTNDRSSFLIIEEAPDGVALGTMADRHGTTATVEGKRRRVNHALRGQPISADELDALVASLEAMNAEGIYHHDIFSNTHISRDASRNLQGFLYDSEPGAFRPIFQGTHEDRDQLLSAVPDLIATGAVAPEALSVLDKYPSPQRCTKERVVPPNERPTTIDFGPSKPRHSPNTSSQAASAAVSVDSKPEHSASNKSNPRTGPGKDVTRESKGRWASKVRKEQREMPGARTIA